MLLEPSRPLARLRQAALHRHALLDLLAPVDLQAPTGATITTAWLSTAAWPRAINLTAAIGPPRALSLPTTTLARPMRLRPRWPLSLQRSKPLISNDFLIQERHKPIEPLAAVTHLSCYCTSWRGSFTHNSHLLCIAVHIPLTRADECQITHA